MNASEEIERLKSKLADGSLPADEPLFVLRARDVFAANTVRLWGNSAALHASKEKLEEALKLSELMDKWPVKQIPGRPETKHQFSHENFRVTAEWLLLKLKEE